MPNHITNRLTVVGNEADVKAVMNCLADEKDGVTFDNFAPMPEELRGTTSPTRIVSQEEYDQAVIQQKEQEDKGDEYLMSLPITMMMQGALLRKYGVDNWYDWACKNWGTKWGAYNGVIHSENCCTFDTAWSTPVQAMETLSKKFPNVTLHVEYADEDFGYNVGKYTLKDGDGDAEIPEGGSLEALEMAMNIKGNQDYVLGDWLIGSLEDLTDDCDVDDITDYDKYCLDLAYKTKYDFDGYPKVALNYLIQLAESHEDYEYANRVKKFMDQYEEKTN